MAESIRVALDKLEGNTITKRDDGLEDLKRIFGNARGNSKLDSLGDAGFSKILESLFAIICTEKARYLSATTKTSKSNAESKLSAFSAALRVIADAAATRVKHKTAIGVLDHVVDILPLKNAGLLPPLSNDYMKIFRSLLQNPSLREHLKPQEWESLVEFIIESLEFHNIEDDSQPSSTNSRDISADARTESRMSTRVSQASRSRTNRSDTKSHVEELIVSLKLLTSTFNPALTANLSRIVDSCLNYLNSATKFQEPALEVLNNVFPTVLTSDMALARSAIYRCIPILRRTWSTRSGALKDQMLAFLINARDLLSESIPEVVSHPETAQLQGLFDTISHEYMRRQEKDFLQMEDIYFPADVSSLPLHTSRVAPLRDNSRAVTNWTSVAVLGGLLSTLHRRHNVSKIPDDAPSKRRKVESILDEIVRQALNSPTQEKLYAIQTLMFAFHDCEDVAALVAEHAMDLATGLYSENDSVANWSMLLISRFTFAAASKSTDLKPFWSHCCNLVARNMSSQSLTRAACHFFDAILATSVLEDSLKSTVVLEALFSNGSQGPCLLTDSALSLWHTVLTSGQLKSAEAVQSLATKVIGWLNTHWTLPVILDRVHNALTARYAREDHMYKLLKACMGTSTTLRERDFSIVSSPIHTRCSYVMESVPVFRYLLHQDEGSLTQSDTYSVITPFQNMLNSTIRARLEHAALELLLTKLKTFRDARNALQQDRSAIVSTDIMQILSSVCVVASSISFTVQDTQPDVCTEVLTLAGKTWDEMCVVISSLEGEPRHRCLLMVSASLLRVDPESLEERALLRTRRQLLASPVLDLLQQSLTTGVSQTDIEDDLMDFQHSYSVQNSQNAIESDTHQGLRQKVLFATELHTALVQMTCRMMINQLQGSVGEKGDTQVASTIIDFTSELSSFDFVAARQPLVEFFESSPSISRSDAARFLEILGQTCLQEVEFERCEAALCFCVDILAALAKLWTVGDDDLASMACDIYEWYLDTVVGKGIATEQIMLAIARMLTAVSASDPGFGSRVSLPSPRTSLLRLLKAGSHVVKFNIAGFVCEIFEGFVLSEHWAIFDDVVGSLPSDPERVEGIAIRLYILGKLASKWHTLLRKAVYSIFETAAHISAAMPFAQKSFNVISHALALSEPRELFVLFSPQILYTWLAKEALDGIPYQVFRYKDLPSLLQDVLNEAVGQIAMRHSSSHATALSRLTGMTWDQLLHDGFSQAEAYCIAYDISTPRDEQSPASEAMLRKQIGNDLYLKLIQENFPLIIARLFTIISDDQGVEKVLSKRKSLNAAQTVLMEISKRSQSTIVLPRGQQPSFRAKYVFDEIDYLCKRIDRNSITIWESSLVVYVCRMLFDTAKPALGPLHSCAVIRKVRLVVCLAGPQALRGYPLEMLLHILRPFLTDFHCSEDALGLFWYLVDHGKPYLESKVSFIASLAMSTFATISSFLGSSQDSTTQESHFVSTMSKVQTFREWMVKYLQAFKPDNASLDKSATFNTITRLASGITIQGGSTKGTPQGDLLYLLIQDQQVHDRLLTRTMFFQVMEALCFNFNAPENLQEDVLYLDTDAARAGPILLPLLDKIKSSSFKVWVAQAIGRAYACSGHFHTKQQQQHLLDDRDTRTACGSAQGQSYAIIVTSLITMLRKDDRQVSGMAERALQSIFTGLTAQERSSHFGALVDKSFLDDMTWMQFSCPAVVLSADDVKRMQQTLTMSQQKSFQIWACDLAIALCGKDESNSVLTALPAVLISVPSLAPDILASIAHVVLLTDSNGRQVTRQTLSTVFNEALADWKDPLKADHVRLVLDVILYLRDQPIQRESTMADRNLWLEVNLADAAAAASSCGKQTAALLFLELSVSQKALQPARTSRISSAAKLEPHLDLVQQIFYSLDDPDFFFGVQEKASLQSVLVKLAHEDSVHKNLSFQSALFDSECKISVETSLNIPDSDIVAALSRNNLNGIAHAVHMQANPLSTWSSGSGLLQVSMNLNQWDLPPQTAQSFSAVPVLNAFRALENFSSQLPFIECLDTGLKVLLDSIVHDKLLTSSIESSFGAMAVLTELRELFSVTGLENVREELEHQRARARWETQESFDLVSPILVGREATINAVRRSGALRSHFRISLTEAQLLEINTVRNSLKVARSYSAAQFSLNRAMYLSRLIETQPFSSQKVEAAILHDTAHVLWDQGEASASIQMLRQLIERNDLQDQAIALSKAEILADLGHQTAEARLNKPDEIIAKYLLPAIEELREVFTGYEAGRVFHNFAVFCDMQLQNAEDKEEFSRVEGMRQSKLDEIEGLAEMIKTADPKRKDNLKKHLSSAKQWFKLDNEEYQRLKNIRERFIAQSLENYLRSMAASDTYTNDTLRFVALWLDQSGSDNAQRSVERCLATVASRKFAPLMNQLFSRILDSGDPFQRLLTDLLYRVCCDHPHHSLYQLFAASKSKGAKNDIIANLRYSAAGKLADKVMKQSASGNLWIALHNCSIAFVRLANEKLTDHKVKSGSKILLRSIDNGRKVEQTVHDSSTKIPPPTMKIHLRVDCDYSSTPSILKFNPEISIAGGVSAPKIITILASDGTHHKMLLKGGNDDLRQDSIMEQVFEQVSNLLKDHRTTRQRNLGIRIYKVLPLTPNAGIIEFVKDTIPLHEYLLPAHQRYFPKDWKANKCRKDISDAQNQPLLQRVQAYRTVCANFRPVMRFFFMEHFLDPDEWFQRRLAFSRSVAATSILGHVLGLGDRHGHNILLDEHTGEVIHIDLGVAFEAGRILPVPEVVPFRLTRDLVDGMGISGVEGVFRRCCNFTLEALRQDQYSIMTVLDVLRYDPLYSWSMTPLRLQKMQEAQEAGQQGNNAEERDSRRSSTIGRATTPEEAKTKEKANEASEADRALTVVAKKLGRGLSVEATVNELIQQATDEKNLATLYCGWAAYA